MDKIDMAEKELLEKIDFCSYVIKYGSLINATSAQTVKAFKLKGDYEEELNVLRLQKGRK